MGQKQTTFLAHGTKTDDVGDSAETMNAFVEARLLTAMEVHALDNMNPYPAADSYRVAAK